MKKLFITDYIGLCNRLDSLCLSFAIQKAHGHQICLDWPETDALRVTGTVVERFCFFDRLGSIKLRNDPSAIFSTLGRYRRIVQRTWLGPSHLTDHYFPQIASAIHMHADLWAKIQHAFAPCANVPVVGVHIRRGDFQLAESNTYDAVATRHPAVPIWWYEYAMGMIVAQFPGTRFLLSCSGNSEVFPTLKKNFDVFELDCPSPYRSKSSDHQSTTHPVADLFGLACCKTIIGTPLSTFTHYAANAFGPPSVCLLPPLRTHREQPGLCRVEFPGRRATEWVRLCREASGLELIVSPGRLPVPEPPAFNWAKTWR